MDIAILLICSFYAARDLLDNGMFKRGEAYHGTEVTFDGKLRDVTSYDTAPAVGGGVRKAEGASAKKKKSREGQENDAPRYTFDGCCRGNSLPGGLNCWQGGLNADLCCRPACSRSPRTDPPRAADIV